MIKLTVDPKVLAAMQQAFPKPAASAERALKKYVGVLEDMLTKSLHSFLNLLHSAAPSKPIFSELLQLFYQGEHDSRTLDFIQAK